jgi:hypothetical protein
METILSSPVSRTHLVLGKFMLVLTASLITAVLLMASVGISSAVLQKTHALDQMSEEASRHRKSFGTGGHRLGNHYGHSAGGAVLGSADTIALFAKVIKRRATLHR